MKRATRQELTQTLIFAFMRMTTIMRKHRPLFDEKLRAKSTRNRDETEEAFLDICLQLNGLIFTIQNLAENEININNEKYINQMQKLNSDN